MGKCNFCKKKQYLDLQCKFCEHMYCTKCISYEAHTCPCYEEMQSAKRDMLSQKLFNEKTLSKKVAVI